MCCPQRPADIVSSQEALLVRFSTDDSMTARGFAIAYVAIESQYDGYDFDGGSSNGGGRDRYGDSYSDEELSTPFPGSLQSMFVLGSRGAGGGGGGERSGEAGELTGEDPDDDVSGEPSVPVVSVPHRIGWVVGGAALPAPVASGSRSRTAYVDSTEDADALETAEVGVVENGGHVDNIGGVEADNDTDDNGGGGGGGGGNGDDDFNDFNANELPANRLSAEQFD